MAVIYKSKYYAVNIRRGIINPMAYNRAEQIKKKYTSPDVIPVKGNDILTATTYEYYRKEFFV